jgi:hypothetical protein
VSSAEIFLFPTCVSFPPLVSLFIPSRGIVYFRLRFPFCCLSLFWHSHPPQIERLCLMGPIRVIQWPLNSISPHPPPAIFLHEIKQLPNPRYQSSGVVLLQALPAPGLATVCPFSPLIHTLGHLYSPIVCLPFSILSQANSINSHHSPPLSWLYISFVSVLVRRKRRENDLSLGMRAGFCSY